MGIIVPWTVFMKINENAYKVPHTVVIHNEHSLNIISPLQIY